MSAQSEADEQLREAISAWMDAYDHGLDAGELQVDFAAVVQIRSYGDDEVTWDRYELVVPAGVALHSAKGLLSHGWDLLDEPDDDADD